MVGRRLVISSMALIESSRLRRVVALFGVACAAIGMVRAADKILRFDSASPTVANLLDRDGVLLLDPVDDDVEKARLRYLLPSGYTLKQAEGGALLVARVDHAGVRTIRVPHVRDDDGRDAPARWLIDPPADGEQAAVILE
ncbi:MAG: hypothetical protein HC882_05390, partial [Acidobacteria bacterium]|nr:hypothetical protein [Acidobacteriota bacterium]